MIQFCYYGEDCHVLCCDLYPEQERSSTLPFKRMVDPQEKHWRVDKLRLKLFERKNVDIVQRRFWVNVLSREVSQLTQFTAK